MKYNYFNVPILICLGMIFAVVYIGDEGFKVEQSSIVSYAGLYIACALILFQLRLADRESSKTFKSREVSGENLENLRREIEEEASKLNGKEIINVHIINEEQAIIFYKS